jgi:hypothetical protein
MIKCLLPARIRSWLHARPKGIQRPDTISVSLEVLRVMALGGGQSVYLALLPCPGPETSVWLCDR